MQKSGMRVDEIHPVPSRRPARDGLVDRIYQRIRLRRSIERYERTAEWLPMGQGKEYVLSAAEALNCGIVDEVIE